ncbi:MAG TPA: hypothetical protein VH722_19045 [Alphaproteobacteria bacterium]|nr:hypothetical protein [Alphaproteobacteria bacterium]
MRLLLAALFLLFAVPAQAQQADACAYLSSLIPIEGGPLFLPSYPTAEEGPLRGVAFLYDDAVTAIALIGCGEAGKARRIGDAMLAALDHDRAWHDGRLRNAYAAGPVDNPVKLGGWWDQAQGRWVEDRYQVSSDTGNMAWAMLALLTLDRALRDARYRDGAIKIAGWVAGLGDTRGAGGFTGGFLGWEPSPVPVRWKSTEHNTDLAGAFALLAKATGDEAWADRARQAAAFVGAMWDDGCACFAVGTGDDGVTPNPVLALDAELWPLLAIPAMASHAGPDLDTVDSRLAIGDGYTYSDAGSAVWTEGTAQAALVWALLGHPDKADQADRAVEGQRAPRGGYFATPQLRLKTGFADSANPGMQRYYFHLPHLAAAAWVALAEKHFNPFTASAVLP